MGKYNKKLIILIEKISQIIRYIQREISKKTKVSPLMIQIMEYVYKKEKIMNTPAKIAEELGIKRPTITDSLKILIKKGYIKEIPYEKDKRYKILFLTQKGRNFLEDRNLNYKKILEDSIKSLKESEKKDLFLYLVKFVANLNRKGILPIASICFNCENFERNKFKGDKPHYCKILKKRMGESEIKVNCKNNIKRRNLWVKV